jgi:hypothetical protein
MRKALRFSLGTLALLSLSRETVFGLIKLDDGHDQLFVNGSAGLAYDSDIFASSSGEGDTSLNSSLDLEYKRKAGMLGVNADLGWDFAHFFRLTNQDYADPHFSAQLTKDGGRTTGWIKFDVRRQDRADVVVNTRTESWNYEGELKVKYPVIERYSISGDLGFGREDFLNNDLLTDFDTYTAGADVLYALNSTRDLSFGYRYRATQTAADTLDQDHAITVGVAGKIAGKFNGSAKIGVQERLIERRDGHHESHGSLTASISTTWTVTSRFAIIGDASRDFSTAATDMSVDATNVGLTAQYSFNPKLVGFAGANYGHVDFIDELSGGRRDDSISFNTGLTYTYSERFKVTATYTFTHNWSTFSAGNYDRHLFSFSVSSRW